MEAYRCYFLGRDGQFVGAETFPAKDDHEALWLARRLYAIRAECADTWHYGFEVWHGPRRVHSEPMSLSQGRPSASAS